MIDSDCPKDSPHFSRAASLILLARGTFASHVVAVRARADVLRERVARRLAIARRERAADVAPRRRRAAALWPRRRLADDDRVAAAARHVKIAFRSRRALEAHAATRSRMTHRFVIAVGVRARRFVEARHATRLLRRAGATRRRAIGLEADVATARGRHLGTARGQGLVAARRHRRTIFGRARLGALAALLRRMRTQHGFSRAYGSFGWGVAHWTARIRRTYDCSTIRALGATQNHADGYGLSLEIPKLTRRFRETKIVTSRRFVSDFHGVVA